MVKNRFKHSRPALTSKSDTNGLQLIAGYQSPHNSDGENSNGEKNTGQNENQARGVFEDDDDKKIKLALTHEQAIASNALTIESGPVGNTINVVDSPLQIKLDVPALTGHNDENDDNNIFTSKCTLEV